MVILEFLVSVLYVVVIIAFVIIVLALAIGLGVPFVILYGIYWLLFRSWRKDKIKHEKGPKRTPSIRGKDIKNLVKNVIHASTNGEEIDEDELKREIKDIVGDIEEIK